MDSANLRSAIIDSDVRKLLEKCQEKGIEVPNGVEKLLGKPNICVKAIFVEDYTAEKCFPRDVSRTFPYAIFLIAYYRC